jgi:4-azaleucine resistance transporter AzlC
MKKNNQIWIAFRTAFPYTVPIFGGFVFLGIAYGIYMNSLGFNAIYPILMSLLIFAGSMEFVAANLLLISFNPINALFLTLMVNARHLFYGISMLDKYRGIGKKKLYMIYGLCDESFSINCTVDVPKNVDKGWFMFFVTLLNHFYWVIGSAIGGIFGSLVKFNTEGLDFVMTALFVVIFIEQWMKEKKHHSALVGIGLSTVNLIVFGGNNFIIPAMFAIFGVLTLLRKPLEKVEVRAI